MPRRPVAPVINSTYFVLVAAFLFLELKTSERSRVFIYYKDLWNAILNSFKENDYFLTHEGDKKQGAKG